MSDYLQRPFRLLDLPAELRTAVYEFWVTDVAGTHLIPIKATECSSPIRKPWAPASPDSVTKNGYLLATCKQVHSEAGHILYTRGTAVYPLHTCKVREVVDYCLKFDRLIISADPITVTRTGYDMFFGQPIWVPGKVGNVVKMVLERLRATGQDKKEIILSFPSMNGSRPRYIDQEAREELPTVLRLLTSPGAAGNWTILQWMTSKEAPKPCWESLNRPEKLLTDYSHHSTGRHDEYLRKSFEMAKIEFKVIYP